MNFKEINNLILNKDLEGMIPYCRSLAGKHWRNVKQFSSGFTYDDVYSKVLEICWQVMNMDTSPYPPSVIFFKNVSFKMRPSAWWTGFGKRLNNNDLSMDALLDSKELTGIEKNLIDNKHDNGIERLKSKVENLYEWDDIGLMIVMFIIDNLDYWYKNANENFGLSVIGNITKYGHLYTNEETYKKWKSLNRWQRKLEVEKVIYILKEKKEEWI